MNEIFIEYFLSSVMFAFLVIYLCIALLSAIVIKEFLLETGASYFASSDKFISFACAFSAFHEEHISFRICILHTYTQV